MAKATSQLTSPPVPAHSAQLRNSIAIAVQSLKARPIELRGSVKVVSDSGSKKG